MRLSYVTRVVLFRVGVSISPNVLATYKRGRDGKKGLFTVVRGALKPIKLPRAGEVSGKEPLQDEPSHPPRPTGTQWEVGVEEKQVENKGVQSRLKEFRIIKITAVYL